MIAADIYDQVAEVTGICDQTINFQAISRAVELLSNEGLFDSLIGYVNFSNSDTNIVTLPREVKTVLRVNINNQPTFFRNRLFEFTLNTEGSNDGESIGYSWADRGYSPIQEERKLPGRIAYICNDTGDIGKSITLTGRNVTGDEITETLLAATTATYTGQAFYAIERVDRQTTNGICLLYVEGTGAIKIMAQYYPDETQPMYRVIHLSKKVSNVRIMFRRDTYEVRSLADNIPLNSKMAIIHAAKAVRYFAADNYDMGRTALAMAVEFLTKEQASRDEQDAMAQALELPTAIDTSINVRDSIIVSDVYDPACLIFGNIGRPKIFDKITTAIEVLSNKANWDSGLGVVDIWMPDRTAVVNVRHGLGSGYFVLPRFVESVVSLNIRGEPAIARNRWFEFHLNGTGERNTASRGAWDDAGETCIIQELLRDPDTRQTIPVQIVALPSSSADNGKIVRVYGVERLSTGEEVEVRRSGEAGCLIPCVAGSYAAGSGAPRWVEIHRVVRDATTDFVKLVVTNGVAAGHLLGYWYPDEVEPKYRAVRVYTAKAHRIRVLYRKRQGKITSLFQPIPLRSRLALENMLRALKAQESDVNAAMNYEMMAVNYLSEERMNSTPSDVPMLQFDSSIMPGFTGNIS